MSDQPVLSQVNGSASGSNDVQQAPTKGSWRCTNVDKGCLETFQSRFLVFRHAKGCSFARKQLPKVSRPLSGTKRPFLLERDGDLNAEQDHDQESPQEESTVIPATREPSISRNEPVQTDDADIGVPRSPDVEENNSSAPNTCPTECTSEDLAEKLGALLIFLHGKKLSYKSIDCLLELVTDNIYSPGSTRDKFYNSYTLRKHAREVESEDIESAGFTSAEINILPADYPASADVDSFETSDDVNGGNICEGDSEDESEYEWAEHEEDSEEGDVDCSDRRTPSAHAVLWFKDPVKVLSDMVAQAVVGRDILLEPQAEYISNDHGQHERFYSNPMGGDLAVDAFEDIKKHLSQLYRDSDGDNPIVWFEGEDGLYSVVGGYMLYTDKSKLDESMEKCFYPVHLCLINFSKEFRQRMVLEGNTIVAFLPTHVEQSGRSKASRMVKQLVLHKCLRTLMAPVSESMEIGLRMKTCPDESGMFWLIVMHLVLVLYVTDIPEGKDIICVKHSNTTAMPCASCKVSEADQSESVGTVVWRSFSESCEVRDNANEAIKKANALNGRKGAGKYRQEGEAALNKLSLSPLTPFFGKWKYVDGKINAMLDAHRILGFERMHSVLGLVSTILTAVVELLGDKTRFSSQLRTKTGSKKSFATVKAGVIEISESISD